MGPKLIGKIIDRALEKRYGSSTNIIKEVKELKKEVEELKKNSHPPRTFVKCENCNCKIKEKK